MRICSTKAFLLSLVLSVNLGVLAQEHVQERPVTQLFKEDGWVIPGLKEAVVKPGTSEHRIGGYPDKYQSTIWIPKDTLKTYRIPTVRLDTQMKRFVYSELTVRVVQIRAYESGTRAYCYQVSVMVNRHPDSSYSGWAGEEDVWYYDETGTGTFTLMDTGGPISPQIPPAPSWARPGSH